MRALTAYVVWPRCQGCGRPPLHYAARARDNLSCARLPSLRRGWQPPRGLKRKCVMSWFSCTYLMAATLSKVRVPTLLA